MITDYEKAVLKTLGLREIYPLNQTLPKGFRKNHHYRKVSYDFYYTVSSEGGHRKETIMFIYTQTPLTSINVMYTLNTDLNQYELTYID